MGPEGLVGRFDPRAASAEADSHGPAHQPPHACLLNLRLIGKRR